LLPFEFEVKEIPPHVVKKFREMQEVERSQLAAYGAVKKPITATVGDTRFVAVGNTLHFNNGWRLFTDFLTGYLAAKLGREWGTREVTKPDTEQHPAVYWYNQHALASQKLTRREDGLLSSTFGCSHAWLRLAYDIYLINHNADLQAKLLRRIRDRNSFQGARFEAAVAAMMLAAGYELEYSPEKGPGKHPEFIARHKTNGQSISVEAKSRHRPGIMGYPGEMSAVTRFNINKLLSDAVNKDTKNPLLVFVEVNCALTPPDGDEPEFFDELAESWKEIQAREWPRGFPAVGVVFYNDVSPWSIASELPEKNMIWSFALPAEQHRHQFDAMPLVKEILRGTMQRSNIPTSFPA
jgi:hypothetical protein